ncbi:MAG: hypothetical protein V4850_06200 [Myxococcota bacterium]
MSTAGPRVFTARRSFFSFLGPEFRFFGADGQLALFVKQKAFRLKEEITAYRDEGKSQPVLRIQARSIMDVRGTYDVTDASTGERVGTCKRQGLKSLLRDTWELRGVDDTLVGTLSEDSLALALVRRFLLKSWLPQTFSLTAPDGRSLGKLKQRFNPFLIVYDCDFGAGGPDAVDTRLATAATVLLLAIEGRQG